MGFSIHIAPVGVLLALLYYYFKQKAKDNLKEHIHQKGGEFVELTTEIKLKLFNTGSNTYHLVYLDSRKRRHEGRVRMGFGTYTILEDRLVEKEEVPVVSTPVYSDKITETRDFDSTQGRISIQLTSADIEVGNKVFINNYPAKDGKYKLGFLHYIYVKDGRIC